jgi:2-keto-4-pentenoate hydratase/2-oxohepta-3-ene-1,7-dioic acid hydratase in catechol pathway
MRSLKTAALALVSLTIAATAADAQVTQYVRYEQGGTISWGELDGETIHQLSTAPYLDGARTGQTVARSAVTLKAPVDPKQIFMTAFNFLSHISGEPAQYPGLFLVPPSSIIGPEENIVRPPDSQNLHYEAEMVAVVGREATNVSVEDAPNYIFGVSAGNDVSERTWQGADIQWSRAKGSRTFNAVGPVLVRGLDYHDLDIEGRLNGEVRQGENTSDLLFDMHEMLSYISTYFTLYPGDLIWTGTMGSTRAMEPGDVYEVEIEGIGILRNPVVQGM